ncbi:MAG TPA: GEVED domain-containing protein, partial [Bacteroidia bacterium]|nr:GEVED domain-containing protein [Bacteroidia bacterium]
MNKVFFTCSLLLSAVKLFSQCPTDSVFTLHSLDASSNFAVINQVWVDNGNFSFNSSFTGTDTSYQSFYNATIPLMQNGYHHFEIFCFENGPSSVGVWFDLDRDHIFEQSEMLGYDYDVSGNGYTNLYIQLPAAILSDTMDVRVVAIYDPSATGFTSSESCNFLPSQCGEVEDYKAFVNCNTSNNVSFDPYPQLCFSPTVTLTSNTYLGTTSWYSDTTSSAIYSGDLFQYTPVGFDTVFYIQNVNMNCSTPFYPIHVHLLPSPVVDLSAADSIFACSPVTLDAGPHMAQWWSTGGYYQTETLYNNFSGFVFVTVDDGGGCQATDSVWVSVDDVYYNVMYDQYPITCFAPTVYLYSNTVVGTTNWYSDTTAASVFTGDGFQYNPTGLDTIFYIQNTNGICSTPFYPVEVHLMPAPVVDLSATDSIFSCSQVVLDAGQHMSITWNNGSYDQTDTINAPFAGMVSVFVDDGTGCQS